VVRTFQGGRIVPQVYQRESSWRSTVGFILLTFFQTEYGIPCGPGADVGEHFESAADTSSIISVGAALNCLSLGGGGEWFSRGEKVVQQDLVHLLGGLCPGEA